MTFKKGVLGLVGFLAIVGLLGSFSSDDNSSSSSSSKPAVSTSSSSSSSSSTKKQQEAKAPKWNTKEADATKNGNWQIAVKEMNKVDDLKSIAETADPSSVLKAPWNYYGTVLTFTGTVSDIKENPPDSESSKRLGGSSYSVVVNLENDVTVQGEMAGSSGNIKEGQQLTIYGYPVGTIEGNNTMGGHPVYICIVGK